jgi:hypothetical protein
MTELENEVQSLREENDDLRQEIENLQYLQDSQKDLQDIVISLCHMSEQMWESVYPNKAGGTYDARLDFKQKFGYSDAPDY